MEKNELSTEQIEKLQALSKVFTNENLNLFAKWLDKHGIVYTGELEDKLEILEREIERKIKKNQLVLPQSFDTFSLVVSLLMKNKSLDLLRLSAMEDEEKILEVGNKKITLMIKPLINNLPAPNYFHFCIMMAVGSILDRQQEEFQKNKYLWISSEQVLRVMGGLTSKNGVTQESIDEMDNIIEQLNNIKLYIDFTELRIVDEYGNKRKTADTRLINYSWAETRTNRAGNDFKAFKIIEYPILYSVSKDLQQIRSLKSNVLKIAGLRSSKQNMALKFWLIQQIESMKSTKKNGKRRTNKININNMFESLEQDFKINKLKNQRVAKNKHIKQMLTMLEYWKGTGYIKDFQQDHEKRSLKSVKIIF